VKVKKELLWLHFYDNFCTSTQVNLGTVGDSEGHALRDIGIKKMLTNANLNKAL